MATVTVTVVGGPSVQVPWTQGMNAQQALELAYTTIGSSQQFTYALQYFGVYGYLVVMINDTYETFASSYAPNYYWEFLVNGLPASSGIDSTILNAGDLVSFELQSYVSQQHANTSVGVKHAAKSTGTAA
jgi:hypothetical protein